MPGNKARFSLVLIWFGFFALDFCLLLYLYIRGWIGADNFYASVKQVVATYGPFLGAICLFYYGSNGQHIRTTSRAHTPVALAIVTSLFWNCVICVCFARLVFMQGSIEASLRDVGFVGSMLAWIVSPALGYYFAKSSRNGGFDGEVK